MLSTINMKRPVRLAVLVLVLLAIYRARLNAANHKKAVKTANSVQDVLTKAVVDEMEGVLVDLQWESMLQQVDKFFAASRFQEVPKLLSINTTTLVERASGSVRASYDAYITRVHRTRNDVLVSKLPLISQLAMDKLRGEMMHNTSDPTVLGTFEKNMEVVADVLAETTRKIVTENTEKRLVKLAYIFEQVLEWKTATYNRFLFHVLRTRSEMDPGSQLDTWVELETQQIVADGHVRPLLQAEFFEQYIGNSQALIELLEANYARGTLVYSELDDYFSRRASRVSSILAGQYNRVYAIRIEQIDADSLLSEDQKRNLKVYAREFRDASQASKLVVSTSIGEIRRLYLLYADRLLKEVRVLIVASFLEYEAISLRAMAEGRQTCIIQFFEMRRALDEAFLFEYCKERSFDLDVTRSDLAGDFEASLQRAGTDMLSLTRTGYILYMYDQARSFLLERANLFFRDDSILLTAVKPVLAALHDDYASIVPLRLQGGIDEEMSTETELARVSTWATFNRFVGNMEFSFVAELINGAKASIIQDMTAKVGEIHAEFANLSDVFVRDALDPFDFAWFQAESERFTTDDQIRYIDMKQHVIDETNKHASVILESTRSTYTLQIESLFGKVDSFVLDVAEDLTNVIGATTLQQQQSVASLSQILQGMKTSMASLLHTMQASTLAKLEETLGSALGDLEQVQGIRTKNFFNTKIQQIKDGFTETVIERVVEVYESHMAGIETKMLTLSAKARETLRENVDELLEIERNHRRDVEEAVEPLLQEQVDQILADFNIVSFSAREIVLVQQMKNVALTGSREVASQRRLALRRFNRKWYDVRTAFRQEFLAVADQAKVDFRKDVTGVVTFAKTLASDVMGHVSEVIDALQRDMFHALETAFTNVVNTVIGTSDNDLAEAIDLASVVYSGGITDLTDAPALPSQAFLEQAQEEGEHTTYGENGEALPSVDKPSGLTTLDITLALMPWDDWLNAKLSEIVQGIVIDMQYELKQNTCRKNKPPCREGWVQYTNSWDVECCRFDPASQGFPAWQITKMLAKEILLALVLDLGNLVDVGKAVSKKVGLTKFANKGLAKGKKMMAKSMQKFAGKSSKSMTNGIKIAGKMGGKSMTKVASRTGVKVATKVGTKVGAKLASMGAKFMGKLSLGPAGIALMIFDVISLILDLWDPAGYNDAQTAGLVRAERDGIEKNYAESLTNEGFESPLLADPMFDVSPERQEEVYSTAVMDWFQEESALFMTKHEAEFELMPDSEVEASISQEYDRLATLMGTDSNLVTNLVVAKLENVFVQDISVRENHANPFTDGGKDSDRKHTRQNHPNTGIVEMVLNRTGVEAFNNFQPKKTAFKASLKYNPMKRFVRRKHDFIITKEVTSVQTYLREGTPSNRRYAVDNIPTADGSRAIANSNSYSNGHLKREILKMANEGWAFVEVDPEDEFWVQYDPNKTTEELLDRTKYQHAHNERAAQAEQEYDAHLDALISAHLDQVSEEGADPVNADDLKVVYLAQSESNWTTDASTGGKVIKYPMSAGLDDADRVNYTLETLPNIPDWAGTYVEHRADFEAQLEETYAKDYATEEEQTVQLYLAEKAKETERVNAKASEEGKTPAQVIAQEQEEGRNTEPDPPEFAVFLNGYGQSSPLYSVYKSCTELGHGVTYNVSKGLCNFTESYCKRYGLDFFFNDDLGVYDCELSRGQAAAEYIFGTTVTRSTKRFFGSLGATRRDGRPLKKGSCLKAVGNTRVLGNVRMKHVQNAEGFNSVQTASALGAIKSLGLSGFN